MNRVRILECTLRDGSYAIDFKFTAHDTSVISAALEAAGFDLIEIGHGSGLGASVPEIGLAAASDEEYVRAAAQALKKAKFGAFFIPGLGTKEHLDMARHYGMSFIRIGTNVTRSEEAREFIEYGRKLGFEVSYNAMKSYAVSPEEFQRRLKETAEWGAETVYLVDSAGGMMPNEVREYVARLRDVVGDTGIGFHGHNNFGLANANALAAIEAGATMIDTTMLGMGRSSGNSQTEVMLVLLEKLGYKTGVDLLKAMEVGERLIQPLMTGGTGVSALEVTMASAQFHSSFLPRIEKACEQYHVDAKLLITEVSKVDVINPSQSLIMSIAERCAGEAAIGQSAVGAGTSQH
ncbi:MAG: 4-hydroxy 2-oxovalerate aldolase [Thermoanaerobaculia bacterium]|jgi:4-hydroxy-2-oxovalerate aldolase|nr:4-hydroxy 2-oxovalerate aldolase [Thermoanaerobaculia bacterium]